MRIDLQVCKLSKYYEFRFQHYAEPIKLRSTESVNNNRWNAGANGNVQRANASAVIDQALRGHGPKVPCHKWGSRDNVNHAANMKARA